MTVISTWMLALFVSSSVNSAAGGPLVIENMASREECLRIQEVFYRQMNVRRSVCIEVRKAKQ